MNLRRRTPDASLQVAPRPEALAGNRRTYEDRWGSSRRVVQVRPDLWAAIAPHTAGGRGLEIGSGLRPTLPVRGSFFVDISLRAAETLAAAGGRAVVTGDGALPFADATFTTVAALEVLEHVEHDQDLANDIHRVLVPGGLVAISVPLHMALWSALDDAVWHVRRYDPDELFEKLRAAGLRVERFAVSTARPLLPKLQGRMLRRVPRFTSWALQYVVFPLETAWRHRFPTLQWMDEATPVPPRAAGITLLARRPEAASATGTVERAV